MPAASKLLTVDIDQMRMLARGAFLEFHCGAGMVVNEIECGEAEAALERGETVALRRGSRLTGTYLRLVDGEYREVDEP